MFGLTLKTVLMLLALTGVATTGYVYYNVAYSPDNWVFQGGSPNNWKDGGIHGAPGPLVGAGLPVIIAYGAYRLIRRRRKPD